MFFNEVYVEDKNIINEIKPKYVALIKKAHGQLGHYIYQMIIR